MGEAAGGCGGPVMEHPRFGTPGGSRYVTGMGGAAGGAGEPGCAIVNDGCGGTGVPGIGGIGAAGGWAKAGGVNVG